MFVCSCRLRTIIQTAFGALTVRRTFNNGYYRFVIYILTHKVAALATQIKKKEMFMFVIFPCFDLHVGLTGHV